MSTFEQAGQAQLLAFQGQLDLARMLAAAFRRFFARHFAG